MSQRHLPTLFDSIRSVAAMQLLRARRGHKLWLCATACLVVVVGVVALRHTTNVSGVDAMRRGLEYGVFGLLVYLVPFLFHVGAIGEEVEARTLPFLTMRPASRAALVLGKYAAGAALTTAFLTASILVMHLGVYALEPRELAEGLTDTGRAWMSVVLLSLTYGAFCMLWGILLPEASGIVAALHFGTIEFTLGVVPGAFRLASMNYLATQLAGMEKGGFMATTVPDVLPAVAAAVIVALGALALVLAVLAMRSSEHVFGKA